MAPLVQAAAGRHLILEVIMSCLSEMCQNRDVAGKLDNNKALCAYYFVLHFRQPANINHSLSSRLAFTLHNELVRCYDLRIYFFVIGLLVI